MHFVCETVEFVWYTIVFSVNFSIAGNFIGIGGKNVHEPWYFVLSKNEISGKIIAIPGKTWQFLALMKTLLKSVQICYATYVT